jgi:proteasome-associated ATPase
MIGNGDNPFGQGGSPFGGGRGGGQGMPSLEDLLEQQRQFEEPEVEEKIKELQQIIDRIKGSATILCHVVDVGEKTVGITSPKGLIEVEYPEGLTLSVGDAVRASAKSFQIIEKSDVDAPSIVTTVENASSGSENQVEVSFRSESRLVKTDEDAEINDGDEVVVSNPPYVVLDNLGSNNSHNSVSENMLDVRWDDIGGLDDEKELLQEVVEFPFKHPDLYDSYGRDAETGILLHGPPGCGKTLLAKATAGSLADSHGFQDSGFIYVKGPELLNKYVGSSEAAVRSIFEQAREHYREHGYPAVVFVDEADALLGRRGQAGVDSMNDTVVPMFLSEMDGFDETSAVVMLATNRPDQLDPAVTRDGRVDRKVKVSRPDQEAAEKIARIHLSDAKIAEEASIDSLAERACELLYDDSKELESETEAGGTKEYSLADIVNGAMIAGVVDKATSLALRRDIREGSDPSGIKLEDIEEAVEKTYEENRDISHMNLLGLEEDGVDGRSLGFASPDE